MITGFFLTIFLTLFNFIVNVLPTVAFPTEIQDAFVLVWGYAQLFSLILPVDTMLQVFALALAYHAIYMVWRLGHMIMGYIRGV